MFTSQNGPFSSLHFLKDNNTPRKTVSNIHEPVTIDGNVQEVATATGLSGNEEELQENIQPFCDFKVSVILW